MWVSSPVACHSKQGACVCLLVQQQIELIPEVQSDEFWLDVTTPILENVRKRVRSLVKLIEEG
jgi:hypothetical protein